MSRNQVVETTFAVRYAESDQMGVVHHASYIIWMEEGRSQYMRAKGFAYEQVEREGLFFAVADLHVRYVAPARYGDNVTVRTWVAELRSRAVTFGYEILDAAARATLVTGEVKLILMDRQGRAARIPDTIQAALRS